VGETEIDLPSDDDSDDDVPLSTFCCQASSSTAQPKELPLNSDQTSPKRRKVTSNERNFPQWKKIDPAFDQWNSTNSPEEKFAHMLATLSNASMLELFEQLFSKEVFQKIVDETIRYATEQKNKPLFQVTIEDIKICIGFLIFSGYHNLPSERDYWSDAEDLGVQLVKDAMSRNRYLEINSFFFFICKIM
jgi:hypothetical protein